jgi:hypothetical protein
MSYLSVQLISYCVSAQKHKLTPSHILLNSQSIKAPIHSFPLEMPQTPHSKKTQRKPNEKAITSMTDEDIARYDQLMRVIDSKSNPTRESPAVGRAADMKSYGEKMPSQEVTLMRFVT